MKAKLLKKVRKRYSITHYPNGAFVFGDFWKGPLTILQDGTSNYRVEVSNKEKQQAYGELYLELLRWIQQDYGTFKSRTTKITSEQLWYSK